MTPAPRLSGLSARLRKDFITGAMVLLPLVVIGYLASMTLSLIQQSVLPIMRKIIGPQGEVLLPVVALLLLLAVILVIGKLAQGPAGRRVTRRVQAMLERIPVVGPLIGAVRQIADTMLNKEDRNLKQTCLIEFPKAGTWCVGLISADPRGEIAARLPGGDEMLAVYVGLPPFTSAFLVFVPKKDVILLKMAADDEIKLLATAGIAYPADR